MELQCCKGHSSMRTADFGDRAAPGHDGAIDIANTSPQRPLVANRAWTMRLAVSFGGPLPRPITSPRVPSSMSQPAPVVTQNADVRFLGKLLGDVIRMHGGDALFQRIEAIRAASVDRYRGIANPRGLTAGLETLSLDETVAFVRSFMLFSMLANLAEDRQAAAAEDEATLASALAFLSAQG